LTNYNGDKNICPSGWHVSSDDDWNNLIYYVGGQSIAGNKLKEVMGLHWYESYYNSLAKNEFGFTALPSGYRNYSNGNFQQQTASGWFWSIPNQSIGFSVEGPGSDQHPNQYNFGFAVRCVKD
jgi:uncharacterized protein (TIGR02145 family)